MPYRRKITVTRDDGTESVNHRYYLNRKLPGFGPESIRKSLDTSRKRTADQREEALLRLAERGEYEIIEAFLDDRLSIARIQAEHSKGQLGRLRKLLERPDESLADAIDDALEVKRATAKRTTVEGYRSLLERFAVWLEAEVLKVDEEERDEERPGASVNIVDALADDRAQKYLAYRKNLGRAESTVNNDRIALSVLTRHCEKKGWIEDMPDFEWSQPAVRIRWLEPPQVQAYLTEFAAEERTLHSLLLGTGLRLGEALGLLRGNVRLDGEGRVMIEQAKSNSGVRTPFVPRWASDRLAAWLDGRDLGPADPVFTVARRTVQKHHTTVCRRLGLTGQAKVVGGDSGELPANPTYTIHDHRHTAAVALARTGMPLHLLQRQLGHGSIDMTMRYAEFHPEYNDVAPYFDQVADAWTGGAVTDPAGKAEGTI